MTTYFNLDKCFEEAEWNWNFCFIKVLSVKFCGVQEQNVERARDFYVLWLISLISHLIYNGLQVLLNSTYSYYL